MTPAVRALDGDYAVAVAEALGRPPGQARRETCGFPPDYVPHQNAAAITT